MQLFLGKEKKKEQIGSKDITKQHKNQSTKGAFLLSSITLYYVLYETSVTFLKEMFRYPAIILVTKQGSIARGTIAKRHTHAIFEAAHISILFDQYLVFHWKQTV